MKSPENNFLRKVGKGIRNTALGITTLGVTAHMISQDRPDDLQEGLPTVEVIESVYKKFDLETLKELKNLENAYVQLYVGDHPKADPIKVGKRFESLIAKYGDGLRIVLHDRKDKTVADKMNDAVFTQVLRQDGKRAHYANSTLFYENIPNTYEVFKNDTGQEDSMLTISDNLSQFASEFAHHINQDSKIPRVIEYVEDLTEAGFHQQGMYGQSQSVESQAHSVTQSALLQYLFAGPQNSDVSFESIKNEYQSVYDQLMEHKELPGEWPQDLFYLYRLNFESHIHDFEGYRAEFFARIDYLKKAAERMNYSAEMKKKFFENLLTWEVFEWQSKGTALDDYINVQKAFFEANNQIQKKNFEGLVELGHNKVLEMNPELLGFFHYTMNHDRKSYEGFLDSLTIPESQNYIDQAIPLYMTQIEHLERELEADSLTWETCIPLEYEIELAQKMSQKIRSNSDRKQDIEKEILLNDLVRYVRILKDYGGGYKQVAKNDLQYLSPNFYRLSYIKNFLNK